MRDRRSDRDPTEAETTPFSVEPSKIALAGTRLQSEKCEYAFISPLGAGGSGTVFRAINIADGAQVAIKILHAQQPLAEDLTRFAREARILREIDHPNIIRFLDYGKHDAYHFIVTELAEGGSLAPAIASDQCLDEMTALRVLKQIALALVAPHEQGIVHRDLKPANILLTDAHRWKLGIPGTIKVADFGLARPVRSDGSVRVTKSGAMLGTPAYMAPEQGLTTDVTPAADVYALGAILFRLLVGRIPFDDIDPINLIMRHRHERPPRVADLAEVSPATSALVATALEKTPARRYPDSRTLLEAVTQILSGTAKNIEQHPRSFVPVNSNLQCFEFQWQLECSPTELWPYVSNTDRLNEAANLPSVEFVHESDDHGQIKTFGQFRLFGLPIRWEEHPFEWIEGKRLAVERTFSEGPFRLLISEVELEPLEGTGTSLVHRITVDPRGIVGRATASFEIGVKAKSALTRVYRHIDEWAAQRIDHCEDPFRSQPARRQQARPIKQHLDNLRNRHPSRTSVIQLLEKYLTRSSPQELAAIRPLVVAKRLGLKVNDVLDTFLALTSDGLLGLSWDIICPKCRVRSECHPSLADVAAHANCVACGRQYDVDFAQSVELLFRQIDPKHAFDRPVYCIGGPGHAPHVLVQIRLRPLEHLRVKLRLAAGSYLLRLREEQIPFFVSGLGCVSRWDVELHDHLHIRGPTLATHEQELVFANHESAEVTIRIERRSASEEILSAAQVNAYPAFQSLFPYELLAPHQLMSIQAATVLACQLFDHPPNDSTTRFRLRAIADQARACGALAIDKNGNQITLAFAQVPMAIQTVLALSSSLSDKKTESAMDIAFVLTQGPTYFARNDFALECFGPAPTAAQSHLADTSPAQLLIVGETADDPFTQFELRHTLRANVGLERSDGILRIDLTNAGEQQIET